MRKLVSRGMYITKSDLQPDKYGLTPGCKGCIASNRGKAPVPHDDRCRVRIEDMIKENEPERYERALDRVCKAELGKERGVKRRAISTAETPGAPAQTVVKTYSEGGASSSATDSVVDLRHANTDVGKLSKADMLKCESCQHDNAKWFKRCMNCGASLASSDKAQTDSVPQPMEGMNEEDTTGASDSRGYKRAHRDEGETQGDLLGPVRARQEAKKGALHCDERRKSVESIEHRQHSKSDR